MKAWCAAAAAGLLGCATPPAPMPSPAVEPSRPAAAPPVDPRVAARAVLARFIEAVEARDFGTALELLSQDWRKRYDVARLERDFAAEPLGEARVKRLRQHLDGPLDLSGPAAFLPLGDGARAALVVEQGGWRIAALE